VKTIESRESIYNAAPVSNVNAHLAT
jgi:hypothetical protein